MLGGELAPLGKCWLPIRESGKSQLSKPFVTAMDGQFQIAEPQKSTDLISWGGGGTVFSEILAGATCVFEEDPEKGIRWRVVIFYSPSCSVFCCLVIYGLVCGD